MIWRRRNLTAFIALCCPVRMCAAMDILRRLISQRPPPCGGRTQPGAPLDKNTARAQTAAEADAHIDDGPKSLKLLGRSPRQRR